ncbi:extracellular solute-binding protein [Flaviflagellibacter deserti]|uniref:Extracellular solute-binding protein n=1 Tax=Flaviflagellibacter deserti TaxID=2267266 RepID=A0ABV9YXC2_9HYPH
MTGGPDRRTVLKLSGAAAATTLAGLPFRAFAQVPLGEDRHGLSAFGDLKYPADFKHFDYVRPDAPKGGKISYSPGQWAFNQNPNTFNSLNTLILKGDAAVRLEIIFASLMTRALDEPDALYGFAAQSVRIENDGKLYRYKLRPEAKFHDGSPLTAEDVAFSIATLKKDGHPLISQQMLEVESAEAISPQEVTIRFSGRQARDIPLMVAGLPILSKAYYSKQPFTESTMEPPLGCGPYKVGNLAAGRFIEYEKVKDWWGDSLPVFAGQNNFDVIRIEMFRDRQVSLEGFKGGAYWFREEFTSRFWANSYDFPAIKDGRVIRFELRDERPSGAQGWWINTRRDKLSDPRVREALICAFDFEWTNANLMFGSYIRTSSVFENSPLKAEGPPSAAELSLLEPFRGKVPDEVFGQPFVPPTSDGSGQDRKLLRRATELLRSAGWTIQDGALRNAKGDRYILEILDDDPIFEAHVLAYIKNLKLLGIDASFRVVDPAQFQSRQRSFDFDMMPRRWALSSTPGDDLRLFFGSSTAKVEGSNNLPGVSDPAIDAMIDHAVAARTRDELTLACKALDRLVRAGRYWVPHWHKPTYWLATWDVFGRPDDGPRYGLPFDTAWWFDTEKAARIGIRA